MKGKPAIYIKDLLHSEEAEEHFKTIYPKEDYPQLYKKGRDVGMIAGERPDSAEVPMPSGGEETPTESENE
jgi:hypothetical protein